MQAKECILVIGDVHGQFEKLAKLLRESGLMDDKLSWIGGTTTLWFIGDFFDRGPDGIGVVELVMRLQQEAQASGGQVRSLLGNHEVVILSALYLGQQKSGGPGGTFYADWKRNGGEDTDLARLTGDHIEWISSLPALARVGDWLFMHADATFYTRYGSSIEEVNAAFTALLRSPDAATWDRFLEDTSARNEFLDILPDGEENAAQVLHAFGGQRLLHGHTPISSITAQAPEEVTGPLVYTHGTCVNVDGGMYLGGPGFVYDLRVQR